VFIVVCGPVVESRSGGDRLVTGDDPRVFEVLDDPRVARSEVGNRAVKVATAGAECSVSAQDVNVVTDGDRGASGNMAVASVDCTGGPAVALCFGGRWVSTGGRRVGLCGGGDRALTDGGDFAI